MTIPEQIAVNTIADILQKTYKNEMSGHDWLHLFRVWKMAKRLSRGQKVDHFVLELAALLHDVDDYKFRDSSENEYEKTKRMMAAVSVPSDLQSRVLEIIQNVSFKGAGVPTPQVTLEGKIVQDADRLDALGAIGIARCFSYGGYKGIHIYDPDVPTRKHENFEEYKTDSPSINHFYEKLLLLKDRMNTPMGKKIAEKRHNFVMWFAREFWKEVGEKP
jgi:uncharacterized protein